jgi:hypothetical protein
MTLFACADELLVTIPSWCPRLETDSEVLYSPPDLHCYETLDWLWDETSGATKDDGRSGGLNEGGGSTALPPGRWVIGWSERTRRGNGGTAKDDGRSGGQKKRRVNSGITGTIGDRTTMDGGDVKRKANGGLRK